MNWKTKRKKAEAAGAPRSGPEGLDIIQDFVSTRQLGSSGGDDLETPDDLARWLVNRGLLPFETQLSEHDWKRAIALREAFYAQVRANSGDTVASRELHEIERISHLLRFSTRSKLRFRLAGRDHAHFGQKRVQSLSLGHVTQSMTG